MPITKWRVRAHGTIIVGSSCSSAVVESGIHVWRWVFLVLAGCGTNRVLERLLPIRRNVVVVGEIESAVVANLDEASGDVLLKISAVASIVVSLSTVAAVDIRRPRRRVVVPVLARVRGVLRTLYQRRHVASHGS